MKKFTLSQEEKNTLNNANLEELIIDFESLDD